MPSVPCPSCGVAVDGRFCAHCGTPANRSTPVATRAHIFCSRCGEAVPLPPRGPAGGTPLVLGGILAVGIIGLLGWRSLPADSAPPPQPTAPARSSIDLSSMTPRQAADRLFDRVMRGAASGNITEISDFLPMAIGAYDLVDSLDADGSYHKALLYRIAQDFEAASGLMALALETDPTHLLLLAEASELALAAGDSARVRDLATRFIRAYDTEVERPLGDYEHHRALLPQLRSRVLELAAIAGQ